MADTLIDHLNNEPKGVDVRHRDIIEWQEKEISTTMRYISINYCRYKAHYLDMLVVSFYVVDHDCVFVI